MNQLARTAIALAALLAATATARADGDPPPPKGVALIHGMVGTWKGTGPFEAGKTRAPISVDWRCQKTSGDWGASCNLAMTGVPGLARYLETDLVGYDAASDTYHWFSVTNAGEVHDHRARVTDPRHLTFQHAATVEGKPFVETIRIDCHGPDEMSITAETRHGGQLLNVLRGTLRK
jgi:hypothetical protein